MQNDEKDPHVAAAPVKAGAQVVVTSNLRDFTTMPDGIEARSHDEFRCNLFDLGPRLSWLCSASRPGSAYPLHDLRLPSLMVGAAC